MIPASSKGAWCDTRSKSRYGRQPWRTGDKALRRRDGRRIPPIRARSRGAVRSCACLSQRRVLRCFSFRRCAYRPASPCISTVCSASVRGLPIIFGGVRHVSIGPASKVAPQHQCGRPAIMPGIIIGAARHFTETRTVVKTQRQIIVLINFQKYSPRAEPRQAAQIKVKQPACEAPPTLPACNRNRKDFRLVLDQPRHDEARELGTRQRAVRDDVTVEQKAFDLLFAPAALE